MKALRCDRCKKFYIYYSKEYNINGKKVLCNSAGIDYKDKSGTINAIGSNAGVEYDLCENCMDKLVNFLEKSKVELKKE